MTSHALAHVLLAAPDVEVYLYDGEFLEIAPLQLPPQYEAASPSAPARVILFPGGAFVLPEKP